MRSIFLMSVVSVMALVSSRVVMASGSAAAEAHGKEEVKADPQRPTTLNSKDPAFETLNQTRHKANATYHIRDFKEGSVKSLEGMLGALKKRSEENLERIEKLNKKLSGLQNDEKEKISLGLDEIKKKQESYLETLNKYSTGPYQTNLSAETLRAELKQIETEVNNVTNLLGTWQKENKTAWE